LSLLLEGQSSHDRIQRFLASQKRTSSDLWTIVKPHIRAIQHQYGVVGVDLVAVTGLSAASVQTIISEIGTDMTKFPTAKHFGSWLGLAPHNDFQEARCCTHGRGKW
jgi:transposase